MDIDYAVQIWRENSQFIAHAMPLDVAGSDETPEAARSAVDEAVNLFIKTVGEHGTLNEVLEDSGYRFDSSHWQSPDWIGIEKRSTIPIAWI